MTKGSTTKTIPAQTIQVCNGCEYLIKDREVYVDRGSAKERDYSCMKLYGGWKKIAVNIHDHQVKTPSWCPFLKEKE